MSAPEPLDAARLAEYLALEAAATPGPWWNDSTEIYASEWPGVPSMCTWIGETCNVDLPDRGDANGAFIAAAREMVPALAAEVARLTARVAELEPPTGECQHESPFGRLCDLTTGHIGDHQRTEGTSVRSWIRAPRAGAR